jgi:glycerol kinase
LSELRVDGGACRNDFLMQFQADLLGCPVNRSRYLESTGMGAAFSPALLWGFGRRLKRSRRFEPQRRSSIPKSMRTVAGSFIGVDGGGERVKSRL